MRTKMPYGTGWFSKAESYKYSNLIYFNLQQIAESGQAFRFMELEHNSKETFHYCVVSMEKYAELIQQENTLEILTKPEWIDFWEDYLALSETNIYTELESKISSSSDKILQQGLQYAKGIRILHQNPFETTVSFMLSSANSIHNIKLYLSRFCKRYGHFEIFNIGGYQISYWTFPTLKQLQGSVTEQDLRSLGFGFRAKNIYDFIKNAENLNLSYSTDLLSVTGIGEKIKDCILLYSNKDYDRVPMDVWMKRAKEQFYGTKDFPWQEFKPYRGICQIYLYHYSRNNKF